MFFGLLEFYTIKGQVHSREMAVYPNFWLIAWREVLLHVSALCEKNLSGKGMAQNHNGSSC